MLAKVLHVSDQDEAVVAALESAWSAIRARDDSVPAVSFYLTSARTGACNSVVWDDSSPVIPMNLLHRDGTKLTGAEVLLELLHQAAHASSRSSHSGANQGRYHSYAFAQSAQAIGLSAERGALRKDLALTGDATDAYALPLRQLDRALQDWEPTLTPGQAERTGSRNGISVTCRCDPPRRLRVTQSIADLGPIVCGVCQRTFEARP